jgi:hypothetical protein
MMKLGSRVRTQALVTLVVGSAYQQLFDRYCRKNWTSYAQRHGYDLIVLDRPLDRSPRARARPFYWQKNLILDHKAVAKYRQIAWIDCDIVINAQAAPPIFAGIPEDRVGAVDEYSSPDPTTYRKALAATYLRLRRLGQPFLHNLTPQEFYRNRGFPEFDRVVQSGVLVCSPQHHRQILGTVYYEHEHLNVPGSITDMAALSCELLTRDLVTWIDHRFNRLVMLALAEHLPSVAADQGKPRSPAAVGTLRPVIAQLRANCYFLHFAGCQALMEHLL